MLKNTGERLILEQSWNLMTTLEHLHRYKAVAEIVKDKYVLDAACGTGYGSHLLSHFAKKVTGIDLSQDAIDYAISHYSNSNLEYRQMSITDIGLEDQSVDAIVSFETIEHVAQECQIQFLNQVVRVLKKSGVFIVSTPNDQMMRDISFGAYTNEFHLCELSENEFVQLLQKHFPYVKMYYQTVTESSAIVLKGKTEYKGNIYSLADKNAIGRYYIAVCSYEPLYDDLMSSCLLPDVQSYLDERYFTKASYLYFDVGQGYTTDDRIECKYISRDGKKFEVKYQLEDYKDQFIKMLRFDPCEYGARIRIDKVICDEGKITFKPVNAKSQENGWDVFMTLDPIYEAEYNQKSNIHEISISGEIEEIPEWQVLEYQQHMAEMQNASIQKQKQEIEILETKIQSLTDQLDFCQDSSEKRDANIRYLTGELRSEQEITEQKDVDIQYLTAELERLKEDITEKESNVLKLEKQRYDGEQLQKENAYLKMQIKRNQLREIYLKDMLNLKNQLQDQAHDQLKKQIEKNFEQTALISNLCAERDLYAQKYQAIESSTAWRMSSPIRKWMDMLKHGKQDLPEQGLTTSQPEKKVDAVVQTSCQISPDLLWDYDAISEEEYAPLVTVIVPNYNHEPYLRERLESIYCQTYQNIEVILLDDCSTDESRTILSEYAEAYADKTQTIFNESNCGKVFKQWDKGIAVAKGDLIWIAESDDYCELNFLEEMVSLFRRESVMLAFARSVFMQEGRQIWTTEEYLSDLPQLAWDRPFTMTAHNLVNVGFGIKNVIPNVSSAVFRNVRVFSNEDNPIWEQMKLCGDWLFYLNLIRGGCVSYTNQTTNYYRVHPQSTSLNIQKTDRYYEEQKEVSKYVMRYYKVERTIFDKVLHGLREHYKAMHHTADSGAVDSIYDLDEILREQRTPNIVIALYSMTIGGEETASINLANEMRDQGLSVTLLDFRMGDYDQKVRALLNPNVPLIEIKSLDYFYQIISRLDADVIHSHNSAVDEVIADWLNGTDLKCKHIVAMQDTYESTYPLGAK